MIKCIQLVLATAASMFVGLIILAALFSHDGVTDKIVENSALASLAVAAMIFVPFCIYWWAERVKEEHERKVNDGSLSYRASQVRYVFALIVIGVMMLILFFTLMHHRGRGG